MDRANALPLIQLVATPIDSPTSNPRVRRPAPFDALLKCDRLVLRRSRRAGKTSLAQLTDPSRLVPWRSSSTCRCGFPLALSAGVHRALAHFPAPIRCPSLARAQAQFLFIPSNERVTLSDSPLCGPAAGARRQFLSAGIIVATRAIIRPPLGGNMPFSDHRRQRNDYRTADSATANAGGPA